MNYYTVEELRHDKKHILKEIYGEETDYTLKRVETLGKSLLDLTGKERFCLFSSPGRTEVCGNHTDHNRGQVLAASINLDILGAAVPEETGSVRIISDGYEKTFEIDLNNLIPVEGEKGTTESLVRGVASGFVNAGYNIGGFSAAITSDVLQGSGLSSSASIEVLIGMIFNTLFNEDAISAVELAKIGQYAENVFFMKACGLMDQVACAVGSGVTIDFRNPSKPIINNVDLDLERYGYSLVIVDTGGCHDDLVPEYESIPEEMIRVARFMGYEYCSDLTPARLIQRAVDIREVCGDRAFLRAMHFVEENIRVKRSIEALNREDIDEFLEILNQSGLSSLLKLQNCAVPDSSYHQELLLALEMTRSFIEEKKCKGACRVHGGGFAGTMQVIIPATDVDSYRDYMSRITGENSVMVLNVRSRGVMSF